ncbi:MAG TPA: hypothetical protein VJO52_09395 [Gemmatimonadaceae bacterium]|nr:hypothetical protein [Gemmatimonadaceae bacterium]
MNDGRLQELYREAMAARDASHGASCPEPEALRALVERDGSEETRLATLDHALACVSCSRELELLRALRVGAPAVRRPRIAAPWLVAASVFVAVAAGTVAIRSMSAPASVLRGPGDARGVALIAPAPHAAVLRWHAVPSAASYVVEVMDAQGAVLAADTTIDTAFALPASVGSTTASRDQWWVRARLSDGSEVRSAIAPLAPR